MRRRWLTSVRIRSENMTIYRIYSIDRAGKIVAAEPLIARSDNEAFDRACALKMESDYEIWSRSKLVGISRRWVGKERHESRPDRALSNDLPTAGLGKLPASR